MNTKSVTILLTSLTIFSFNSNAEVNVTTDGGLRVSSDEYSFRLGGRIMYDYNRSELNGVVDEDALDLRRGRIFVSGDVAEDWSFKAQYEFSDNSVKDMYIRYSGWGPAAVLTVGHQKLPFGLEELESSKDISILERTGISELLADRRMDSVNLSGEFGNQTYSVSAYSSDKVNSKDEDIGYAARYTAAPVISDTGVLHLGIAYRDVSDTDVLGLEMGGVLGPFHAQAEYMDGNFGDMSADGYYVMIGYVLTGEVRPYSGGVFERVTPDSPGGAWELAARYENGYGNHDDIKLGSVTDAHAYAIGVNWYPHKNIRVGASYSEGESNINNDQGNEFRVRIQLTY